MGRDRRLGKRRNQIKASKTSYSTPPPPTTTIIIEESNPQLEPEQDCQIVSESIPETVPEPEVVPECDNKPEDQTLPVNKHSREPSVRKCAHFKEIRKFYENSASGSLELEDELLPVDVHSDSESQLSPGSTSSNCSDITMIAAMAPPALPTSPPPDMVVDSQNEYSFDQADIEVDKVDDNNNIDTDKKADKETDKDDDVADKDDKVDDIDVPDKGSIDNDNDNDLDIDDKDGDKKGDTDKDGDKNDADKEDANIDTDSDIANTVKADDDDDDVIAEDVVAEDSTGFHSDIVDVVHNCCEHVENAHSAESNRPQTLTLPPPGSLTKSSSTPSLLLTSSLSPTVSTPSIYLTPSSSPSIEVHPPACNGHTEEEVEEEEDGNQQESILMKYLHHKREALPIEDISGSSLPQPPIGPPFISTPIKHCHSSPTLPFQECLQITIPLPLTTTMEEVEKHIVESSHFRRTATGAYSLTVKNFHQLQKILAYLSTPVTQFISPHNSSISSSNSSSSLKRHESGVYSTSSVDGDGDSIYGDLETSTIYTEDDSKTVLNGDDDSTSLISHSVSMYDGYSIKSSSSSSTSTLLSSTLSQDYSQLPIEYKDFKVLVMPTFSLDDNVLAMVQEQVSNFAYELIDQHRKLHGKLIGLYTKHCKRTPPMKKGHKDSSFIVRTNNRHDHDIRDIIHDINHLLVCVQHNLTYGPHYLDEILHTLHDYYSANGKVAKMTAYMKKYYANSDNRQSPADEFSKAFFLILTQVKNLTKEVYDNHPDKPVIGQLIFSSISDLLTECNETLRRADTTSTLLKMMANIDNIRIQNAAQNTLLAEMYVNIRKRFTMKPNSLNISLKQARVEILDRKGFIYLLKDSLILTKEKRGSKQKLIYQVPLSQVSVSLVWTKNGEHIDPAFLTETEQKNTDKFLSKTDLLITFKGDTGTRKSAVQIEILKASSSSQSSSSSSLSSSFGSPSVRSSGTDLNAMSMVYEPTKFCDIFAKTLNKVPAKASGSLEDSLPRLQRHGSLRSLVSIRTNYS